MYMYDRTDATCEVIDPRTGIKLLLVIHVKSIHTRSKDRN
jgi:hypothetical protein